MLLAALTMNRENSIICQKANKITLEKAAEGIFYKKRCS
jgi:hypothetical protein